MAFFRLLFILALSVFSFGFAQAADREAIVVVYNTLEPGSEDLARFYAAKRNIPEERLIALVCPAREEISREEYQTMIEDPLRKAFESKGWWKTLPDFEAVHPKVVENKIRFIALIRGVPLKIRASSTLSKNGVPLGPEPTLKTNEASVESELAAMGVAPYTQWGLLPNPYYRSYFPIQDAFLPDIMLVTRLDGPTIEHVRKMIEDSLDAESSGLEGRAYVDLFAPGGPLAPGTVDIGNSWMLNAAEQCRLAGVPVVIERSAELFPRNYPLRDVVLYYGWYREHAAGPFADPNFRFAPGAVAIHLHSFSGQSIRDAQRGWTGPLVARGVTATLGNVYEPYLSFTPQIDIFNDRLLAGFTFAESSYMSLRALSWMTSVIGDPLYRPYARWREITPGTQTEKPNDWKRFRNAATEARMLGDDIPMTTLKKAAEREKNPLLLEAIALWMRGESALQERQRLLRLAQTMVKDRQENAALALVRIQLLLEVGRKDAALRVVRENLDRVEGAQRLIFKDLETQLSPPVPIRR